MLSRKDQASKKAPAGHETKAARREDAAGDPIPTEAATRRRLEQRLDAVLRGLYVDLDLLPYPERLISQRFHMYAQNEEDGLVLALMKEGGIKHRTLIEIGCGHNGGNSGFLARELGFRGLMVDGDQDKTARARRVFNSDRMAIETAFVTREGVNELIASHGITGEIDFLSIDIDGNDAWIWDAIDIVDPRVVSVEYNSLLGPEHAVSIAYDGDFDRHHVGVKGYYGVSLRGLEVLATYKGYRLVVCEPRGTNAFFLRDDVAPHVPAIAAADAFRRLNKHQPRVMAGYDVWSEAKRAGLEWVDLEVEVGRR
jgi:hypothetical protein